MKIFLFTVLLCLQLALAAAANVPLMPVRDIQPGMQGIGKTVISGDTIEEFNVDGVIDVALQSCHPFNVESNKIKEFVVNDKKIHYMAIETDYSQSDVEQLRTRFEAFIEMIEN